MTKNTDDVDGKRKKYIVFIHIFLIIRKYICRMHEKCRECNSSDQASIYVDLGPRIDEAKIVIVIFARSVGTGPLLRSSQYLSG